jgi:hypothetical protein
MQAGRSASRLTILTPPKPKIEKKPKLPEESSEDFFTARNNVRRSNFSNEKQVE